MVWRQNQLRESEECTLIRKILLVLITVFGIVDVAFAIVVTARQHLRFDPPYPDVAASAEQQELSETQERLDFAERLLAKAGDEHRIAT